MGDVPAGFVQNRTAPSPSPVASRVPSGENSTVFVVAELLLAGNVDSVVAKPVEVSDSTKTVP
jgi:hypothetical protein